MSAIRPSFLIVAGAEKCGTTSLFGYLAAHPDTAVSLRKETDYFRQPGANLSGYMSQFPVDAGGSQHVRVESSPGYLAESDEVAPRMAAVVPQARLVFVVRDPIERLRSSFRFYKSRLHVPSTMSFDVFARLCLDHEQGKGPSEAEGLQAWHLGSLARGRYERLMRPFVLHFPRTQLLVMRQSALTHDTRGSMQEICRFAGLNPNFFEDFEFARENVSFMVKRQGLQRIAIEINDRLESVWRRHPAVKRRLLAWYKRVNQRPLDADELSSETAKALADWYAPTYTYLLHADLTTLPSA